VSAARTKEKSKEKNKMKTVVIKIGGSIADANGFYDQLAKAVTNIRKDFFPIIVHGGGKAIARMLDGMNKKFTFVEGLRVTDAETLSMVQMVLSGNVNKSIVNALENNMITALGISGVDCGLFTVERTRVKGQDIGFVGDIKKVDANIITLCNTNNIVPVVSPVSRGTDGNVYNVNADAAAGDLARALTADDLVYVSDVKGVLIQKEVCHCIKTGEIEKLIADGHVTGGMIPKLRSAAQAVAAGVGRVHICGWTHSQSLETELSDTPSGTVVQN
jgi:acetylglutamate kinase